MPRTQGEEGQPISTCQNWSIKIIMRIVLINLSIMTMTANPAVPSATLFIRSRKHARAAALRWPAGLAGSAAGPRRRRRRDRPAGRQGRGHGKCAPRRAGAGRLQLGQVHRAAARHAEVGHRHRPGSAVANGRRVADRRAAFGAGHYHRRRRGRQPGRRQHVHSRLQRPDRYLCRRHPRLRFAVARSLQPRAGRSGQGPELGLRRTFLGRRRHQPDQ